MNHPIIGVPNFDPYPSKDGFITNMVVYPSICAVFGYDIRQAIGGDFGFSRRAAEAFLAQTWPAKVFGLRKPATKKQKMTPHLMDNSWRMQTIDVSETSFLMCLFETILLYI
jgi:hypothetical protein